MYRNPLTRRVETGWTICPCWCVNPWSEGRAGLFGATSEPADQLGWSSRSWRFALVQTAHPTCTTGDKATRFWFTPIRYTICQLKIKATVVQSDSPLWLSPGPPLLSEAFPSYNACYISFWRPCSILRSAQRRSSPMDTHKPHPQGPEEKPDSNLFYQFSCEKD